MSEVSPTTPGGDGSKAVPPKSSSSNKTLFIVLGIVAVIVILPIIAFSVFAFWLSSGDNAENLTEGIIESSTGANVDINENDGSFNIETDEGSVSVGGEQKLPDNLPSAVVVYENQKITSVFTTNQDGSTAWSITAQTSDNNSDVNGFIVAKYAENGWATESTSTFNDTTNYTFKKDNLSAFINVTPEQDGNPTTVSYYITQE